MVNPIENSSTHLVDQAIKSSRVRSAASHAGPQRVGFIHACQDRRFGGRPCWGATDRSFFGDTPVRPHGFGQSARCGQWWICGYETTEEGLDTARAEQQYALTLGVRPGGERVSTEHAAEHPVIAEQAA